MNNYVAKVATLVKKEKSLSTKNQHDEICLALQVGQKELGDVDKKCKFLASDLEKTDVQVMIQHKVAF